MSNLFKRIPATVGATGNEQFDFCSNPFLLSRKTKSGSPVREAQALYARSLARMALQSTALILIIVFSMMTMVKPAQASGTVSATSTSYHVWGPGYILNASCVGLSSVAAIQSCELAIYSKQTSCAAATLVDDGRLYRSTNAFRIITTPGAITNDLTKGGTLVSDGINGPGLMLLCYPPYDRTYTLTFQVIAASTCPAHAQPQWAEIPCTCTNPYKPDQAGKNCVLSEQYTIALSGLGGVVMPNKKLAAYAKVTKSDGLAKSGEQVSLALTVVPELEGQLPFTYTGTLSANAETTGSTTYSGVTDSYGKLSFVFKAPEAGGTHTITATCTNCTNQATGTIKVPGCPVDDLTSIADLSVLEGETPDQTLLTQRLEAGMNGYSLLSPATQAAEQCLAGRINTVVGPPSTSGYKVTSTIRTLAYQKHLSEVWEKFLELKGEVDDDPTIQQRCQTLITKVEGEMGFRLAQDPTNKNESCNTALGRAHCVRYQPAGTDPKHVKNIAFDIPPKTIRKFELVLWLNDLLNSTVQQEANTCGLIWGGTFGSPDRIHFLLR